MMIFFPTGCQQEENEIGLLGKAVEKVAGQKLHTVCLEAG